MCIGKDQTVPADDEAGTQTVGNLRTTRLLELRTEAFEEVRQRIVRIGIIGLIGIAAALCFASHTDVDHGGPGALDYAGEIGRCGQSHIDSRRWRVGRYASQWNRCS